ncbi:phosphatidylinositol 4-phosphate 5-kinase-like protein 1 [Anoplopoma fimbria]|uniref:phosphatidylinositol 4-phosphate 5-kinase-like protein 1 n=1 Tax=Anoplopoma fimbria TaxID=229290 RepID=UPI0023ECF8E3|nr:phosphatidylinositol 4-phosphate 5-kinase-like protein 1 [Anoplopoma fimbria]
MFPNSEGCFFQQDNAPCHTARSVKVWMKDHQIRTLSWPAQSPDLNPIENLYNVIKRKMDGHKPSNEAELLEFLRQEWHKVTQQQCERLVESMPRRMKAVIKSRPTATPAAPLGATLQYSHHCSSVSQLPSKMAHGKAAGNSRAARRRRWWHLRQRWRMVGVFEVNQEHEFYHLTSMIKEGMHASIQTTIETSGQDTPAAEDFKVEQTHEGFEMQTFAASVFAKLRRSLDITEEEYMTSLCSEDNYLQFVSNSKSKADFFLTNNKRFFLKTQSKREVRFLLSNLQVYMDHLEKYPHSLMVRFLGVHRIVIPNQLKKYFIVMQSVFYPDERINIRYDIKGCEVGRWTNPDKGGKQIIKVLKDNNFEGQLIALGQEKSWFANQVKVDAAFLQGLNVLDYSLLLAHQPLHRDELEGKHSLANLVLRTTKSVDLLDSPTGSEPPTIPLLKETMGEVASDTTDCGLGEPQAADGGSGEGIPLQEINCPAEETRTDSELQEFLEHHRRLLPNCKNAIHVIDGPDCRYFVGIIDIFTVYGWKKRMENLWKCLRYPGRAFSTVRPAKYSHRFCQWIKDRSQ